MVLSRIVEEKRKVLRKVKHVANYATKVKLPYVIKEVRKPSTIYEERPISQTTSAFATHSSISTTDDTLSMISTPWSTESWVSQAKNSSNQSWTFSGDSSTTMTADPVTTTTYGIPSPEMKTESSFTISLFGDEALTPTGSRLIQPLSKKYSASTPTFSSWTLETYTSTGLVSNSDAINVKYPWSPSTQSDTLTDCYPSTLTLQSQKTSRDKLWYSNCKTNKPPTRFVVLTKGDQHPKLDWILVKREQIPIRKE